MRVVRVVRIMRVMRVIRVMRVMRVMRVVRVVRVMRVMRVISVTISPRNRRVCAYQPWWLVIELVSGKPCSTKYYICYCY